MLGKINHSEAEMLAAAVNRIVTTEVLEKTMTDQLPLVDDLSDANKVYCGKVSMLFVDMRESTKLPEHFSSDQLVKIYRSYIRTVVQAVRYTGGFVRDFMGDGVLAVFVDSTDRKAEDKAVHAARYITTAIDKILNPVLDKSMKHRISCGIGIHTGEVTLSKVGMKGKEQDTASENEFGIAWIGNSTNIACKYSGAVECGTIFISPSTYSVLSDAEEKTAWKKVDILKGTNVLSGYIAEKHYLKLDEEVEAVCAPANNVTTSLSEQLRTEYRKQLAEIKKEAEELGKKEQELKVKEQELCSKAEEIERREKENRETEKELLISEYKHYKGVLEGAHCKKDYVLAMGEMFWENNLKWALKTGQNAGKSAQQIKQEVSYAMVSIYEDLNDWGKAYDYLVEQAAGYVWLNLSTVKMIVNHVGYCDRLRSAIYIRLAQDDLDQEYRLEFEKIRDWLDSKNN